MWKRKNVVFALIIILVMTAGACLFLFHGAESDGVDGSDTKYLEFMKSSHITDTTESHLRNMSENVQVTPGGEYVKKDSVLYEIVDGRRLKIMEEVYQFVVLDSVIYFTKTGTKGLYTYNKMDKTTRTILSEKVDVLWFTVYHGKFLCLTQNKLRLFSENGEDEKVLLEYDEPVPDHIVMLGGYLLFCTDADVEIIDLERQQKRVISSDNGLAYSYVYAGEESVYFSFQSYFIKGNKSDEKVDSKWNGLWKIDLSDIASGKYSLVQISDVFYERFYCVNEKLYDAEFSVIEEAAAD